MTTKDLYGQRQHVLRIFFGVAALFLLFRAMQLQLLDSDYHEKASATAIGKSIIYPSRGLIFDRNGKLLVNNTGVFDLMVTYNQVKQGMDTLKFCSLLGIDKNTFIQNIEKDWKDRRYSKNVPFIFLPRITPETYARFQESLYEFPGFYVSIRNIRGYPQHNGANILGYISEVTEAQIKKAEDVYEPGDYIGSSGLELTYEKELRGEKGVQLVLKDNLGRIVGPYKDGELDKTAVSGKDLQTGLDIELQQFGEALMQGKRGSIVAIEPATGEILAMVTSPTYDPAILSVQSGRGTAFKNLLTDVEKPLFDRSVQAQYPPGSIIKPMIALIAMQDGVSSPDFGVSCPGAYLYRTPSRVFRWGCHGHPHIGNVSSAIQYSCNSYFFTVFRNMVDKYGFNNAKKGLVDFDNYCYKFGLGVKLETDFTNIRKGRVPTPDLYDKLHTGYRWKSPTIMNIAIGQGELELNTLQMANMAAIIANRGHYYTPHIVRQFRDGEKIDIKYRVKNFTGVNPYYFEPVIEGMQRVISGGTGRRGAVPGIVVCGKTGTSQNPHGEDHSVFFAFAPRDNPKIAIAVFVENAGWGNDYGAPITSLMIDKYINRVITRTDLAESVKGPIFLKKRKRNLAITPATLPGADNPDAPPTQPLPTPQEPSQGIMQRKR